jgi:hypothetical protein
MMGKASKPWDSGGLPIRKSLGKMLREGYPLGRSRRWSIRWTRCSPLCKIENRNAGDGEFDRTNKGAKEGFKGKG